MRGYCEEEEDDGSRWVLSMRTKLSLGGFCFFITMVLVAYTTLPYVLVVSGTIGEGPQINQSDEEPIGGESLTEGISETVGSEILIASSSYMSRSTLYIHLLNSSGQLSPVWNTDLDGVVNSVSLNDINSDGEPELVVSTRVARTGNLDYGTRSLLIYQNIQGSYELVFNETSNLIHVGYDIARAKMVDYYDNQTQYLLAPLGNKLLLIGYDKGVPSIREVLPYSGVMYEFDVGDIDGDGDTDIVYGSGSAFKIFENTGNGVYVEAVRIGGSPSPVDEISISDVDGDSLNEIVVVGYATAFLIYKHSPDGKYREIWAYNPETPCPEGKGIQSVDIGDTDGDGIDEIVTSASICTGGEPDGVSIWEYDPDEGSYRRVWEDISEIGRNPRNMQSLRVIPLGGSSEEMIMGMGGEKLYLASMGLEGYESESLSFHGGTYESLDIWPLKPISESTTTYLNDLILSLIQDAEKIHGGQLLMLFIQEASQLSNLSPREALFTAEWCTREDVRSLASRIQSYEDEWTKLVENISERDQMILGGLFDDAIRSFYEKNLENTDIGIYRFENRLGQLGIEVSQGKVYFLILILLVITKLHLNILHNSRNLNPR